MDFFVLCTVDMKEIIKRHLLTKEINILSKPLNYFEHVYVTKFYTEERGE